MRPDRLYALEDLSQRVAPRSYPALLRQAERLRFADLLSVGAEPEQLLGRFPAVAAPASPGVTPEMLVRRMRNAGSPPAHPPGTHPGAIDSGLREG